MECIDQEGCGKRKRGRLFRLLQVMVLLLVVYGGILSAYAADAQSAQAAQSRADAGQEEKIVRVAYVISENFLEGAEGERKSGYGYEYLQKISYCTGWKYEYVYGSFQESLDRLAAGEIDLMSDLSYLEERDGQILYSDEEQGNECFYVFGCIGKTRFYDGDWSSYGPVKVGVNAGRYAVKLAQTWCEDRNLEYELIEYADMKQCAEDLENGTVDLVIASEVYTHDDWITLEEIESRPYYYGVAKNRPDLLQELNQAMREIKLLSPFYNTELRGRYLTSPSGGMKELSDEEVRWISENQPVRIGYLNDYMPYCGTNEETGDPDGMMEDLFADIRKRYSIDYRMEAYESYDGLKEALRSGAVDVMFPVYGDYDVAESMNVMVSDAVTHSTMMLFNGGTQIGGICKIAVTDSDPFQIKYAQIYYPAAEILLCDDIDSCMDAVVKGDADLTIAETAKVNELEHARYKERIQRVDLQEFINISFAVRRGNTRLLSILNKGIHGLPNSLITNSLILHSQENIRYTMMDFLRDHMFAVCAVIILIFGMIIGNIVVYFAFKLRSQSRILKAEYDAEAAGWKAKHDALTGLLNRTAFQELCQNLSTSEKPLAFLIMDVDKFKDVNDTYGHEIGDRALARVSGLLSQNFRAEDYVIRYAGDEFIVLMMNMTPTDRSIIEAKINSVNYALKNPKEDALKLSVSVGVAFSSGGYREELFNQADRALYQVKKDGGCGCEFSRKQAAIA